MEIDLASSSPEVGHANRAKHLFNGGGSGAHISIAEGYIDVWKEKRLSFVVNQYHHGEVV